MHAEIACLHAHPGHGKWGHEVRSEGELEAVLGELDRAHTGPTLVEVHLAADDWSDGLKRLGKMLEKASRG